MKKILIGMVGLFFILFLYGCSKDKVTTKNFEEKLSNYIKEIQSYTMDCTLELKKGEASVYYDIQSSYLSPNYYKAVIQNKENNQIQVIIRNDTGTYVLNPATNKSYHFQSDWPSHSTEGYFIQSLYQMMISDNSRIITMEDHKIVVEFKASPKTNPMIAYGKISFLSSTLLPASASFYTKDKNLISTITFQSILINPKTLSKTDFDVEATNDTIRTMLGEGKVNYTEQSLLTPTYTVSGVEFSTKSVTSSSMISSYKGAFHYTITENILSTHEVLYECGGFTDIIMLQQGIAAYKEGVLTWVDNGLEYAIYSSDLPLEEMISVANSLNYGIVEN